MNILVFNKYVQHIMARLNIDTGTAGNPATGDTLRTAMTKVNTNFEEVYQIVGDPDTGLLTTSLTNGDIKVQPNGTGVVEIDQLQITDSAITSLVTNGDVTITANGTGDIILGAVTIADNKITTNASNDDIHIAASGTGAVKLDGASIFLTGSIPTSDPNVAGKLWRNGNDLKISTG
jgi:hypothetical protein